MAAMAVENPLKKYELTNVTLGKEIAGGAYGIVYELVWNGMRFAGKKIRDYLIQGVYREKLAEECENLMKLRHPCIVQFIGVYKPNEGDFPIIVMEYLPTTLAATVQKHKFLPEEVALDILEAVSLGICFLHSNNTAHRDLSANNVLLDHNMNAKICDLGVAKILDPKMVPPVTKNPGTTIYMPPEARKESPSYGIEIDIFSFGVLVVHIFYGDWPEQAYTYPNDSQSKIDPNWSKYIEIIKTRSPTFVSLLERCLSQPSQRLSAFEVLELIRDEKAKVPIYHGSRMKMMEQKKVLKEEIHQLKSDRTKDVEISRWKKQIDELVQEKEEEKNNNTRLMQQVEELKNSIHNKASEIQIKDKMLAQINELVAQKESEIALEKEKVKQLQKQLDQDQSIANNKLQHIKEQKMYIEHERSEAWEQLTTGEQVSKKFVLQYDDNQLFTCSARAI